MCMKLKMSDSFLREVFDKKKMWGGKRILVDIKEREQKGDCRNGIGETQILMTV